MRDAGILFFFVHLFACYLLGVWGAKKKIGFGDAFLLSLFLSPLIGLLFVINSPEKPAEGTWKKEQIPDGYPHEVRIQYSRLLTAFHDGEISEEEFEQKKKELLSSGS